MRSRGGFAEIEGSRINESEGESYAWGWAGTSRDPRQQSWEFVTSVLSTHAILHRVTFAVMVKSLETGGRKVSRDLGTSLVNNGVRLYREDVGVAILSDLEGSDDHGVDN